MHNELGHGFLERIYHLSLVKELQKLGFSVEFEKKIEIFYKKESVGDYFADVVVENSFLVEAKCVSRLITPHIMQIKHYLRATGIDDGLLFNFHNSHLEWKRIFR